jgi:hypothetical protein
VKGALQSHALNSACGGPLTSAGFLTRRLREGGIEPTGIHYPSSSVTGTPRARASFFTMRTEGFARTPLSNCEMYACLSPARRPSCSCVQSRSRRSRRTIAPSRDAVRVAVPSYRAIYPFTYSHGRQERNSPSSFVFRHLVQVRRPRVATADQQRGELGWQEAEAAFDRPRRTRDGADNEQRRRRAAEFLGARPRLARPIRRRRGRQPDRLAEGPVAGRNFQHPSGGRSSMFSLLRW